MIDVPAYAKAACYAYYGGDEIDNEVVEEEEAPVKPAKKREVKTVATVAGQAINVTVQQQKEVGQMSPGELLELLRVEPDNDEAYLCLVSHPRMKALFDQTQRVMVAGPRGAGFDLEKTQKYWQRLRRETSRPLNKFLGSRTITIDKALGRIEKILVHPVVAGEFIDGGYDNDGQDWSQVDRDLMEAVLWARLTKHRSFPKDPDIFAVYEELTADELSMRWSGILEDYLEFLDDGGQRVALVYVQTGQSAEQAYTKAAVSPEPSGGSGITFNAKW